MGRVAEQVRLEMVLVRLDHKILRRLLDHLLVLVVVRLRLRLLMHRVFADCALSNINGAARQRNMTRGNWRSVTNNQNVAQIVIQQLLDRVADSTLTTHACSLGVMLGVIWLVVLIDTRKQLCQLFHVQVAGSRLLSHMQGLAKAGFHENRRHTDLFVLVRLSRLQRVQDPARGLNCARERRAEHVVDGLARLGKLNSHLVGLSMASFSQHGVVPGTARSRQSPRRVHVVDSFAVPYDPN